MEQTKKKFWFKARFSIGKALKVMTNENAGIICKALWDFAENHTEPVKEMPQILIPTWIMIRADLEQDEIDRANGKKGGNPALIDPDPVEGGLNPCSRGGEGGLSIEEKNKNKRTEERREEQERINKCSQRFELFWKEYPNKKEKKKAYERFKKINPDEETFTKMMEGLRRQKNSRQWQESDGRFIPYPTTWLNGERWNDEDGGGHTGDSELDDLMKGYVYGRD